MAGATSPAHKTMSSRLLTMKFMQRAAASPTSTAPSTPEEPPHKRRKKNADSSPASISSFNVNALADQRAVQKAVEDEEAKRQAAIERQAAAAGDTRWVLNYEEQIHPNDSPLLALRIVQTGYANIDSLSHLQIKSSEEDSAEDKPVQIGRRSFGKFNRVIEKQLDPSLEDESDSSSEEDEDAEDESNDDADDPTNDLIKASRQEATQRLKEERKAKKRAEKAELMEMAKSRKKKDINLNNLNGRTTLSGRPVAGGMKCHNCGGPHVKAECPEAPKQKGIKCFLCGGAHFKANCPQNKRGYQGDDDGPPRKAIRQR